MAEQETTGGTPATTPNGTFEEWFESQPENVKSLISDHEKGLKSALCAERDNTKALSKQISDLQGAAEEGSELKKQLGALQARLTESERHASFIDGAAAAGCSNAKAAYKLAKADEELWKRDGSPDWDAIKETAPEFFRKQTATSGNAGSGTSTDPNAGGKMHPMDELMRRSIGVI